MGVASSAEGIDGGRRRRASAWVLVIGVVLLVALVGALASMATSTGRAERRFCAGVGLDGPLREGPSAALAAWLAEDPGAAPASSWVEESESADSASFRAPDPSTDAPRTASRSVRYASVSVRRAGSGWQVAGACVRPDGG